MFASRAALVALLVVGLLGLCVAEPPPNATVCETGADDVDEDMLQCYDWDEAHDCDVDAAEIEYDQRCDCSSIIHEDMDSVVNYYHLHYCTFKSVPAISIILHIFWVFLLFYVLGAATGKYLVPILNSISDALRLSQNVAGVTFLALANGAPDVFTSIAAFTGNGDDNLGLGSLLGTGMFLTAFVLGWIPNVEPFTAHRRPLVRDLLFYIAGIGLLFATYLDHKVYLWEALCFVGLYIVYVLVVVIGRSIYQKWKKQAALLGEGAASAQDNPDTDYAAMLDPDAELQRKDSNGDPVPRDKRSISKSMVAAQQASMGPQTPARRVSAAEQPYLFSEDNSRFGRAVREMKAFLDWEDRSTFAKVIAPFEFPFAVALRVTIPLVEHKTWSRTFSALCIVCCPHLIVFGLKGSGLMLGPLSLHVWWAIFGPIAALICYRFTTNELPKSKLALTFYTSLAFACAFIWPFLVANELVDILGMFGPLMHISSGILGVTVLAIGNSLQDVFANITIAKAGAPRMAAAGSIGGPVFNLMVGIGAAFSIRTIKDYPKPYELSTKDKQAGLGFLCLGISLVSSLVLIPIFKFRFSRNYGRYLMALYVVYVLFAILIESNVLAPLK